MKVEHVVLISSIEIVGADMSGENSSGNQSVSPERIPRDGFIDRIAATQTIKAVAFLILVTLLSFLGVTFIGRLISANNDATYWLIELTFALLCGGAGALVGGSADVRSTLNLPGSPVQARLGGATAMVIVGFAVAYVGKPTELQRPVYTVEIDGIDRTKFVDDVRYDVFIGPIDDDISVLRRSNVAEITMPTAVQQYKVGVTVFRNDRNNPTIFARCILTFESKNGPEIRTLELIPDPDNHFRLQLAKNYIDKVVREHEAQDSGNRRAIENEPCVEGVTTTAEHGQNKLLNGNFNLVPSELMSRFVDVVHFRRPSPYAIMASAIESDVPPTPLASGSTLAPAITVGPLPVSRANTLPSGKISSALSESTLTQPVSVTPPTPVSITNPSLSSGVPSGSNVKELQAQVDAYIQGQNLDRTQLYQDWSQVAEYVVQGFRKEFSNDSPLAARYLNLITNALNVIDKGKYLAPTLRPDGDQSTRPNRLQDPIPAFQTDDYHRVVNVLCAADADSRSAAQRLLRSFPADSFYAPLQKLKNQGNCKFAYVYEAAIFYFYNRIVEYDGTWTLNDNDRKWLNDNVNDGNNWVRLAVSQEARDDACAALLNFGYGLDLWDRTGDSRSQTDAKQQFQSMLTTLGSSKGFYPSNSAHIAIALAAINNQGSSSKIFKVADSATRFAANILHPTTGNYVTGAAGITMFAVPDATTKPVDTINAAGNVRIYLRVTGWDLVQAGTKFGWSQRILTSAKN